jgi:hypothetical protein
MDLSASTRWGVKWHGPARYLQGSRDTCGQVRATSSAATDPKGRDEEDEAGDGDEA